MTYQVIKQPDGKLAIFSTYTDTIVAWDATPEEVIKFFVDDAVERVTQRTERILERVLADDARAVYFQFVKTWDEALAEDREHGGRASLEQRP
ncbi:hypothetical protein GCM10027258_62550 [Amycolatopsis stemonae]